MLIHENALVCSCCLQVTNRQHVSPGKVLELLEQLSLVAVQDAMEKVHMVQVKDPFATPKDPVMLLLLNNARFAQLALAYHVKRQNRVSKGHFIVLGMSRAGSSRDKWGCDRWRISCGAHVN